MSVTTFIDKRNQPLMQHVELKPFESGFLVGQSDVGAELHNITRRMVAQVVDIQHYKWQLRSLGSHCSQVYNSESIILR